MVWPTTVPPTNRFLATPTPPATIRAPVVTLRLSVVEVTTSSPPTYRFLAIPTPPATVNAPVVLDVLATVLDIVNVFWNLGGSYGP